MVTWIVCAGQSGARIYSCLGLTKGIQLIQDISHPEGRLKESEIKSDRPGSKPSGTRNLQGHGTSSSQRPKDRLADEFAREIVSVLDGKKNLFDGIILFAQPKFLGKLKSALPKHLERVVIGTKEHDFFLKDDKSLFTEVAEVIQSTHHAA
jgi:protein required for attachment to host cells